MKYIGMTGMNIIGRVYLNTTQFSVLRNNASISFVPNRNYSLKHIVEQILQHLPILWQPYDGP